MHCMYLVMVVNITPLLSPRQMTLVSGLRLLRTVLVDRHSLPPWFVGFVTRAGILATFSVAFLVGRVWLMQGGPDIFNRYVWTYLLFYFHYIL